jgi:hypothetical protein
MFLWIPFSFRYCLLLYSCRIFPSPIPRGPTFFSIEDFQVSPSRNFVLPLYIEAEAQFMACMVSPPSIRKNVRYDPFVKSLVDDEALK